MDRLMWFTDRIFVLLKYILQKTWKKLEEHQSNCQTCDTISHFVRSDCGVTCDYLFFITRERRQKI